MDDILLWHPELLVNAEQRMGEEKEAIKQPDHDMMFVVFSTLLTVTVRKTVQYCKSLSAGDVTPQGAMCVEVGGVCSLHLM